MRRILLIIVICGFLSCDVKTYDRTVYRSPLGQLADFLRERREKEIQRQLEEGKQNYERVYREQKEEERKAGALGGEP